MNRKFILLAAACSLVFSQLQAQDKMTPEFLWTLGRVSDPQLSPDGLQVIYNVRGYNLQRNKGNTDIWKVDFAASTAVRLAGDSSNETSPSWSSDGKKIFYLDD